MKIHHIQYEYENIYGIFTSPHNIVMDLNNVMPLNSKIILNIFEGDL